MLLPIASWARGAGRDGSLRTLSLVRRFAGGVRTPVVAGGRGTDSGLGGAQAEDRSARRRADLALAGGRTVSADLGAQPGGTGHAAAADESTQAGTGADASEEPVAFAGVEPGSAAQAEAVDGARAGRVGAVAVAALCGRAAPVSVPKSGADEPGDRRAGPAS